MLWGSGQVQVLLAEMTWTPARLSVDTVAAPAAALHLVNFGVTLTKEQILLLGVSDKAHRRDFIGQFGEGLAGNRHLGQARPQSLHAHGQKALDIGVRSLIPIVIPSRCFYVLARGGVLRTPAQLQPPLAASTYNFTLRIKLC
jgi:hypothetical protein